MKKTYLTLLLLLLGQVLSYAQKHDAEPQYAPVKWKVGDERIIYSVDSLTSVVNDTVIMATRTEANYKIKIISLKDTTYEIRFSQFNLSSGMAVESDLFDTSPLQQLMNDFLKEYEKAVKEFECIFLVSKSNGYAYEVKNAEELFQSLDVIMKKLVDRMLLTKEFTDINKKREEIYQKVEEFLDEKMVDALQTMLNSFNYIFQAYGFPYTLNQTYTTQIEVNDVNALEYGEQTTKATLKVDSSINKSKLIVDYRYIYDKEEAYQEYVVKEGYADSVSIDEFDITERVVSEFDIKTSWLQKSTSYSNAQIGIVRTNKVTHTEVK